MVVGAEPVGVAVGSCDKSPLFRLMEKESTKSEPWLVIKRTPAGRDEEDEPQLSRNTLKPSVATSKKIPAVFLNIISPGSEVKGQIAEVITFRRRRQVRSSSHTSAVHLLTSDL